MRKNSSSNARLGTVQVLILLSLGLFSCRKTAEEVTYPEKKSLTESVYASGLVKAKDQYEAFTLASGPIQEIYLEEGDSVKVGTPILQVFSEREKLGRENAQLSQAFADQRENQSRIRDLELAIDLAKSKKQNDSLLLVRQRRLWAQGIGSAVELEQRELNFQNSKTAYESSLLRYRDLKREIEFNSKSASKNLAISDVLLSDYVLKSKIDGVVYSILKEKGEMVSPQTPLAIIGSAGDFLLELQVDEYDISKVEVGQRVLVNMDSFKDQVFEAKISRIYPIMDSKSKSFTVEAVFTKAPPKLFPNLTLEANILTQVKEETLVIPRNYLLPEDRVILENGDTVSVKSGIKTYQFAEILEGIDEKTALKNPIQ
ncbi:efflux RND transporter periplasmic adaptor subunit [Algoriphagus sp. AK58]|uniref:efflux RND transporter periplasmic adaptor subunit n=1 Tax=Algoriphagus sp. AK58 TaxID=1406877 RepID=UPI001650853E|nr:efflux RND transporter periplasmic adaptor subunit [Algoriphagus sp. AK58]MBC6367525.1 RND transporter [Algoriphagus sp. AK58]